MITKEITVNIGKKQQPLLLGRQYENNATEFKFDCSAFVSVYGKGTPSLYGKRPGDSTPYLITTITTSQDGSGISWAVSSYDTANPGAGQVELRWATEDGDTSARPLLFRTGILSGLGETDAESEEIKSWLDSLVDDVKDSLSDALTEAKESGAFKGDKGDTGATGATPDITVTASTDDTSGTPAVTVTKSGTAASPSFNLAFTGLKGEQGDKGESTNNIAPLTVPEANKPTAEGENAVAIGKDAEAEWSESVALGCGSKTYAACEVSVGSATYRRRITNVGTPEYEYDTATKGYVDEAVAGCASTSYVDTAIAEAKSYTDTAITETKRYVDAAITAALTVDSEGAAT